nr:T9SS type A sorting domain-containing protein [Bacteroidales bacterium]
SLVSNPNPEILTATIDGRVLKLVRESEDGDVFDLTMRATSDGPYVDFNIHVIIKEFEGVGENATGFLAYPNPTSDALTLSVDDAQVFGYVVYNLAGQIVMRGQSSSSKVTLSLGNCPKGLYYVSILSDGSRMIQKVIVE